MKFNIPTFIKFYSRIKIRFVLISRCVKCEQLVLLEKMLAEVVWADQFNFQHTCYTCIECGARNNKIEAKFFKALGKNIEDYYDGKIK